MTGQTYAFGVAIHPVHVARSLMLCLGISTRGESRKGVLQELMFCDHWVSDSLRPLCSMGLSCQEHRSSLETGRNLFSSFGARAWASNLTLVTDRCVVGVQRLPRGTSFPTGKISPSRSAAPTAAGGPCQRGTPSPGLGRSHPPHGGQSMPPPELGAGTVMTTAPDVAKSPVSRRNGGHSQVGYLVYF